MSSTVDTNVLLYAVDEDSPFHERALDLMRRLTTGPDLLVLLWPALLGYVRIATHPSFFRQPITAERARHNVGWLISLPHVRTPSEAAGFWDVFETVTAGQAVRGNLVSDAHLVALMRQHGVATIWTGDRDFRRFDGITVRDPFV